MKGARTKIGILIDAVHELYQAGIWRGIVSQARQCDVDLVTFVGTTQDGSAHFGSDFEDRLEYHYDVVVDFAVRSDIDGLVVLTSPITNIHGKDYVRKLCDRFGDLPLVCVSEKVPGYHSIIVDNASGIEATIEHLVSVHNLRNIVFIKGPNEHNEAEERLAAYKRGIAANNLAYRDELVLEGGFVSRCGELAIRKLLARKIEFDGVVAVNDYSAFGALQELSRNNLLVPSDVAVTGFDDVPEASRVTPSLATIRQPLERLGEAAVDSILAQLGKADLNKDAVLPTEPVLRRSCGCFSPKVLGSKAVQKQIDGLSMNEVVDQLWETALESVHKSAPAYPGDDALRELIDNLVGSLVWDVQRPVIRHIFLNEVDILLYRAEQFSDTDTLMFSLLRELTVYAASLFDKADHIGEANNLLQQAGTFIREQLAGRSNRTKLAEEAFQHRVRITNQRLVSSFDYDKLAENIIVGLPSLGVRSFALWRFESPIAPGDWQMPARSHLFCAYRIDESGEVVKTIGQDTRSTHVIMPEEFRCRECSNNHILMPYHFDNFYIGFAVYEYSPEAPLFMYEELRGHLSAALTACALIGRK